jgi:hypothetical protein
MPSTTDTKQQGQQSGDIDGYIFYFHVVFLSEDIYGKPAMGVPVGTPAMRIVTYWRGEIVRKLD